MGPIDFPPYATAVPAFHCPCGDVAGHPGDVVPALEEAGPELHDGCTGVTDMDGLGFVTEVVPGPVASTAALQRPEQRHGFGESHKS